MRKWRQTGILGRDPVYGLRGASSNCGFRTNWGFLYTFGLSSIVIFCKAKRWIDRRVCAVACEAGILVMMMIGMAWKDEEIRETAREWKRASFQASWNVST